MLVSSKEVLIHAKENNYAIPAPDYIDIDMARVFCQTAESLNKPVILSYAQSFEEILSLEEAAIIGRYWGEKVSTPVVLHLDHGTDFEFIKRAIDLGFTSVMIDASMKPFDENVAITKKVVEYAHLRGISVEAEIGHVGSGDNYESHDHSDSIYTTKEEALAFVQQTNVDSLAVSIGTAHGIYKGGTPKLSFDTLHDIASTIDQPLVLHGGSGTGDQALNRCAKEGISKINIFTDFLVAATKALQESDVSDYFQLKTIANKAMEDVLIHYYKIFETQ